MYEVTIVNPEAIPAACKKFTETIIKLYNDGKLDFAKQPIKTNKDKEHKEKIG